MKQKREVAGEQQIQYKKKFLQRISKEQAIIKHLCFSCSLIKTISAIFLFYSLLKIKA